MIKKYKIKKHTADIEPHEVLLDKLAHIKESELGITEKRLEIPLQEKIPYFLFLIFILLVTFFAAKVIYLQILRGGELFQVAQANISSFTLIIPERGIIYDKNFKKLVSNTVAFDLVCERSQFYFLFEEKRKKIEFIAQLTDKTPAEILRLIEETITPEILIARNLNYEARLLFETKRDFLSECRIKERAKRNYLLGPAFSHILGYTGKISKNEYLENKNYTFDDTIGKIGIEKYYESYLRGIPGQIEIKKSAKGESKEKVIKKEPVPGNNLILNIDAELQIKLYEALQKSIENIGAEKGAAVALDPRNGAVLALVSFPSYDNNVFSIGVTEKELEEFKKKQALFNRAISGQYVVGSTIKPLEAIAALEEQIISPSKLINDTGVIEIRSRYNPEVVYRFGGIKPHGWVDMRKAIAVSSNIYFYTIGGGFKEQQGLGPSRIKKYLEKFGWGTKTGIDLPYESDGFIPTPEWKLKALKEQWWDGDTYNLSIGQSFLKVTPLQVAVAYSAIANGGTVYQPQLVNKIVSYKDGQEIPIKTFSPAIVRENFLDRQNIKVVREGMRDCVHQPYGTCYFLNNLPVEVAAKTGTAQTSRADFYNTWIALFAPYENPEIVLVVTIENVEGLRAATLPVAYEVLEWYFRKK